MTVGELLVKLGADFSQYDKDLTQAEKQARAAGLRIGDIFRNALSFTLGMGLFEAIRRGFQTVVGEAVNFNAMMEQAQIGFTTMLGSAEKAQAFLNEMAEFAARTPFEYPDLLDAAKRMMAMGFAAHEVLPTLQAVGDAAAGLGLGREGINRITLALGQMRAKSKVSAEEMMQLTEAGVPAWEILAEAMGKSTAEVMKLAERGLIPANQAIQMLIEGMERRFPNMMANMQDTWQGVTSTIKDVWRMTIGALTSNLFRGVTQWLQRVRDFATEFYSTFRQFGLQAALAKSFGPEFAATVNMAVSALRGLWNTAKTVLGTIARYWTVIKPIALSALAAFLSFRLVTWVFGLAAKAVAQFTFITAVMRGEAVATFGILNFVTRAVQIYQLQLKLASMAGIAHVGVLQVLRTALYSVWAAMGPLGWAIMGVSAADMAGIGLWSKYAASVERANLQKVLQSVSGQNANVADSSQQAAEGMKDQADATKEAGKAAAKNIQSFDEVHQLMEDTAGAGEDITAGLDQAAMPSLEAPGAIAAPDIDMGAAIEQVKPTLAGFWDWIKQGFVNAWDGVKTAINNAWNALKEWAQAHPIIAGIAAAITALFIPALIKAGVEAVVNGAKVVASWTLQAIEAVKSIATQIAQFVIAGAKWAWLGIQATVNAGKIVLAWAMQGWEAVKSVTAQVVQFALAGARWLWLGIQAGIGAAQVAAAWVLQRTQALASVAVQVAQMILVGAKWVWMGVTAMANAAVMAAAWFIALGPVAWVIATIAAVALAVALNWDTVKAKTIEIWNMVSAWLSDKWEWLKGTAQTAWDLIRKHIIDPIQEAWGWLERTWGTITGFLERTWQGIKSLASTIWGAITQFISGEWNLIKTTATTIWNAIATFFSNTWNAISDAASKIWEIIKSNLQTVWDSIKTAAETIWDTIRSVIQTPIETAQAILTRIWDEISPYLERTWNWIKSTAETAWGFIRDNILSPIKEAKTKLEEIWGNIAGFLERTWQGIKKTAEDVWNGILTTIKTIINSIIKAFNSMIKQLNKIHFSIPDWVPVIGGKSWGFNLPTLSLIALAEGGIVTRPTAALIGEAGPEAVIPLSRSGFADDMATTIAQAVYAAIRDAFRVIQTEQGAQKELILEIDGKRIARAVLPGIISEGQRTGLPVVLRSV